MSQFYVTLPSNSSLKFFPQNKLYNYTTQLSNPIELHGEWEVGLSEIQYPHTWYNVTEGHNAIFFDDGGGTWTKRKVPAGYYKNTNAVLVGLHAAIDGLNHSETTIFEDNINIKSHGFGKVRIKMKHGTRLKLTGDVAALLGFPDNSIIDSLKISPAPPDMNGGMFSLYVYTDIVTSQIVGDTKVPLLRIVKIDGEDGDFISKTYEKPQYIPLIRSSFSSIEIDIKDDTGRNVPFERGKVMITLHFRQRRSPYFR